MQSLDVYPQIIVLMMQWHSRVYFSHSRNSNSMLKIGVAYKGQQGAWKLRIHLAAFLLCDVTLSLTQTEKQLAFHSKSLEIECVVESRCLFWSGKCVMDTVMEWWVRDLSSSTIANRLLLHDLGQILSCLPVKWVFSGPKVLFQVEILCIWICTITNTPS